MERESVESSNIKEIGYDVKTRTLEIQFHWKNSVYQYYDVPSSIYSAIMVTPSKGDYFNARIKGKYKYKLISKGH